MQFEWDEAKNTLNQVKHGISFEIAQEVFFDPFHLSIVDERFNYYEERWITIGEVKTHQIVVVAHLYYDDSGDEHIRIISARPATSAERRQYEHIEYP
jgi:hypothetical protein